MVNTDQMCHSSNLQEPEETMRRKREGGVREQKKKLSLCFLLQVAATLVFGLAHTKRHFVLLFFLCMYYHGDLFGNDALGDDTV